MDVDPCPNCGGTQLIHLENHRYRCEYCQAVVRKRTNAPIHNKVEIVIKKGANVSIKKGGHLVLKDTVAKFTVEDGAEFNVEGTFEVEEPGDSDEAKAALGPR